MSQHLHRFRRLNIGKHVAHWVMQCNLPGCNYYVSMQTKSSCPSLVGKIAKCNKCGDAFELNRRALRFAHPICDSCVVSPKKEKLDEATALIRLLDKAQVDDSTGT